ncbi:hypothetical protein K491DRAFT_722508 [Lophiostoma macrostomum CBS 122681]|uniref:Uncharacterized protein n=1 Tax=Lophiostoma macrostomum CBS 122681 TaxID=1314788 RepID=A0A6A6SKW9_9PLEO|nr:hypothetical protein K491DRAFT_722508 [Lophiostoma macrostomum CBS 122681]
MSILLLSLLAQYPHLLRLSQFNIDPDADELDVFDWLELSDTECDDETLMDDSRPGRRKRAESDRLQVNSETLRKAKKSVWQKKKKGRGKGSWVRKGTVAEYKSLQDSAVRLWS